VNMVQAFCPKVNSRPRKTRNGIQTAFNIA
jgi:hypothetical protein